MRRHFNILLLLLLISSASFAQIIINNTGSPNILTREPNRQIWSVFIVPVYADTASALTKGVDSLGMVVQIRTTGSWYKRDTANPGHKWTLFGSGGGGGSDSAVNAYPLGGIVKTVVGGIIYLAVDSAKYATVYTHRKSIDSLGALLAGKVSNSLSPGNILIGNGSSIAQSFSVTGDIAFSSSGGGFVNNNAVTNAKAAQMASHTYKGNNTGSTANAADLTPAQVMADMVPFTPSLQGLVPSPGGASTHRVLEDDGAWHAPGSSVTYPNTVMKYSNGYGNFPALNTDSIAEGATNKFYTDTRARGAIAGDAPINYNSGTGHIGADTTAGRTHLATKANLADSGATYRSLIGNPMQNYGQAIGVTVGLFGNRPSASTVANLIYMSSDSGRIEWSNGGSWIIVGRTSDNGQGTLATVYLTSFGGKGDGRYISGVSMTSGNNVVTTTGGGFVSSDVGKWIGIGGAASGGGFLRAQITAVNNSFQVVISINASTTISTQQLQYGTDNTIPLQNAIYATFNGTAFNGVVKVSASGNPYLICDSVRTVDRAGNPVNNVQVYIPTAGPISSPAAFGTIEIQAEVSPNSYTNYASATAMPSQMTILQSTIDSGGFLGNSYSNNGPQCSAADLLINMTTLNMTNICLRTHSKNGTTHVANKMAAADMRNMGMMHWLNTRIDTESPAGNAVMPDTLQSFALRTMAVCNWLDLSFTNTIVMQYGNGFQPCEHARILNLYVSGCVNAMFTADTMQHSAHIDMVTLQWNTHQIKCGGPTNMKIDHVDFEDDAGINVPQAWMRTVIDWYEPVNTNSHVTMTYFKVGPTEFNKNHNNIISMSSAASQDLNFERIGFDSLKTIVGGLLGLSTPTPRAPIDMGATLGVKEYEYKAGAGTGYGINMISGEKQLFIPDAGSLTVVGGGDAQSTGVKQITKTTFNPNTFAVNGLITALTATVGRFTGNMSFNTSAFTAQAPIDFGTQFNTPTMYEYNGGTGLRAGPVIQSATREFFIPSSWNYDIVNGGDVQAVNTNVLTRVVGSNGDLLLKTLTDSAARLHIGSGTNAIAPIKLTAGPVLTTPKNGAIEFDGVNFYGTAGGARVAFGLGSSGITRIAPLDSLTKDVKGIQVSGISLVPQSADGTFAGLVTAAAQSFAGVKTFTSAPIVVTQTPGTNNTTAASTAYADAAIAAAKSSKFTETADNTITNTTTQITMVGTGVGSNVLGANTLISGSRISIKGFGYMSTAAVSPSLTFNFSNSSSGSTITAPTLTTLLNNTPLEWEFYGIVRTTGASGTISLEGWVSISGTKTYLATSSAFLFDTTTTQTIDLKAQFGTADPSNTIVTKIHNLSVN